jgi:hypothetical protein
MFTVKVLRHAAAPPGYCIDATAFITRAPAPAAFSTFARTWKFQISNSTPTQLNAK